MVILRRAVKADWALSRKTKNETGEQIEVLMPDKNVQAWEYAVLITNSGYVLDVFGQLFGTGLTARTALTSSRAIGDGAASQPRILSPAGAVRA